MMEKVANNKRVRSYLEGERQRLYGQIEEGVILNLGERRYSAFTRPVDAAMQESELLDRIAFLGRTREQLAEVEHALRKLEHGTYGVCDACGNPIPAARLEALPQTSLCINCKLERRKSTETAPGLPRNSPYRRILGNLTG